MIDKRPNVRRCRILQCGRVVHPRGVFVEVKLQRVERFIVRIHEVAFEPAQHISSTSIEFACGV